MLHTYILSSESSGSHLLDCQHERVRRNSEEHRTKKTPRNNPREFMVVVLGVQICVPSTNKCNSTVETQFSSAYNRLVTLASSVLKRRSCNACKLKLSSTLANGQSSTSATHHPHSRTSSIMVGTRVSHALPERP